MRNILLISTGGTIAAIDKGEGLQPELSSEDLVDMIPETRAFCTIHTLQVFNIDSSNIQPENWLELAAAIQREYDRYDGFVITHGTDTMAYTSSMLSYLIQNPAKPIVITGSQKPIVQEGDGRKNLLDAFWFASRLQVAGVYLVFDGKAIVGTRASKVKSKSYDAFESINYPVAAYLDNQSPLPSLPLPQAPLVYYHQLNPKVFLLKLIPGIEPDILDYVGLRYDAIVIESYGMGGLPFADGRNFLDRVEHLAAQEKIVVIATQVKNEGSDLSVYQIGLDTAQRICLLQSMDMTIEAVVTKLMWILSFTREFKEVQRLFYQPVHQDIQLWPADWSCGKINPIK